MQYVSVGGGNGTLHYTYPVPTRSVNPLGTFYLPYTVLPSSGAKAMNPDYVYPASNCFMPLPLGVVSPAVMRPSMVADAAATPAVSADRKHPGPSAATSDVGVSLDDSLQASDVLLSDLLRDIDGSTAGDDGDGGDGGDGEEVRVVAPLTAEAAAAAPARPVDGDSPNALLRLIASLRAEMTDDVVGSRVMRMPMSTCLQLVPALAEVPQVMLGLCINSRGNIIAHLVQRLGGDVAAPLVCFVRRNLRHLAADRNGCIALPRIMEFATDAQLDTFFAETMTHVQALAVDMYGNYVVKYFVTSRRNDRYVPTLLHDYLMPNLLLVATNKFGSHVLESTIKNGGMGALINISSRLFNDSEALRVCAFDRFANYCVQSCLRNLRTRDPTMFQLCSVNVLRVLEGSPYEKNIMKQMGRHLARFASIAKSIA